MSTPTDSTSTNGSQRPAGAPPVDLKAKFAALKQEHRARQGDTGDGPSLAKQKIAKADVAAALSLKEGLGIELMSAFSKQFGRNLNVGIKIIQRFITDLQGFEDFVPNFDNVKNLSKLEASKLNEMLKAQQRRLKSINPFTFTQETYSSPSLRFLGMSDHSLMVDNFGKVELIPLGSYEQVYKSLVDLLKSSAPRMTKLIYEFKPFNYFVKCLVVAFQFYHHVVTMTDGTAAFLPRAAQDFPPAADEDMIVLIDTLNTRITAFNTAWNHIVHNPELIDQEYSYLYDQFIEKLDDPLFQAVAEVLEMIDAYARDQVVVDPTDTDVVKMAERVGADRTDVDFAELKETQKGADTWITRNGSNNKRMLPDALHLGDVPITDRIDHVLGKNFALIHAASVLKDRASKIIIHGAQSKTLVRCIPHLAEFLTREACNLYTKPHDPKNPSPLAPIFLQSPTASTVPHGASLVKDIKPHLLDTSPTSPALYCITDLADYTKDAPRGTDAEGTGLFGLKTLLSTLETAKFHGIVLFPWHIPNQATFAEALDEFNQYLIGFEDVNKVKHAPMKLEVSYLRHPHLASDSFWFVFAFNYSFGPTARANPVISAMSSFDLHMARLKHMYRCTRNIKILQLCWNTGITPRIADTPEFMWEAYVSAVCVSNEGKNYTVKQAKAAMATTERSETTRQFRDQMKSRTSTHTSDNNNNNAKTPVPEEDKMDEDRTKRQRETKPSPSFPASFAAPFGASYSPPSTESSIDADMETAEHG